MKRRGDVIDQSARDLIAFQNQAAAACNDSTAEAGAQQQLISVLWDLSTSIEDPVEINEALDLWLAWEDEVQLHGSIAAAAAASNSTLQGAFKSHGILLRHLPACAFHIPNGN